jgi:heat shock protein HslJ
MRQQLLGAGLALLMVAVAGFATAAGAPLRGTTWALPASGTAAPPSFKLDSSELRVAGCNRISGSFVLDGAKLSFGSMVSTRRACYPDDGTETRFLKALSEVRGWRMEGAQLVLLSDTGSSLLRLAAVPDKP